MDMIGQNPRIPGRGFRPSPQQRDLEAQLTDELLPVVYVQCQIEIQGDLNVEGIRNAIWSVTDEREALRTYFRTFADVGMVQLIDHEFRPPVIHIELTDVEEQRRDAIVEKALSDQRPNLRLDEAGPSLTAVVATLSRSLHILVLTAHAMNCDRRGLRELTRLVVARYEASRVSEQTECSEIFQYGNASQAMNDLCDDPASAGAREFWSELSSANRDLFRDAAVNRHNTPDAIRDIDYEKITQYLECSINEDIAAHTRADELSVRALLLTCWAALWARMSSTQRVLIGVQFDGRTWPGFTNEVGLFERYLPVPLEIEFDSSFQKCVRDTSGILDQISQIQDYYSQEAFSSMCGVESCSGPEVLFEFHKRAKPWIARGAQFEITNEASITRQCLCGLICHYGPDRTYLELRYHRNAIDRTRAEGVLQQFVTFLKSALNDPNKHLRILNLMDPREREKSACRLQRTCRGGNRLKESCCFSF